MKRIIFAIMLSVLFIGGCSVYDGLPKEPDTPEPTAHKGVFSSEHGVLEFFGDGENIRIDFDADLSALTGLPEGEIEGSYCFLSGELPPHGSIPIRYDMAHEMQITVGETSAVINLGIVAEDGKSSQAGIGVVTPERIPMVFIGDESLQQVLFEKEDSHE